jgi:hypothetical protein
MTRERRIGTSVQEAWFHAWHEKWTWNGFILSKDNVTVKNCLRLTGNYICPHRMFKPLIRIIWTSSTSIYKIFYKVTVCDPLHKSLTLYCNIYFNTCYNKTRKTNVAGRFIEFKAAFRGCFEMINGKPNFVCHANLYTIETCSNIIAISVHFLFRSIYASTT